MSKSLGNVISPFELVEKYGTEATRYLLLRHVHPTEDTDITWERLDEWYTANLVNGLGNLVARVMKLAEEYLPEDVVHNVVDVEDTFSRLLGEFKFNETLDVIWKHVSMGDEYMTTHEPYKNIKDEETKDNAILDITNLVGHIATLAHHLEPLFFCTARE